MFKTYGWRTASLVMALTTIIGLALPAHGGDGRPFTGHLCMMLPRTVRVRRRIWADSCTRARWSLIRTTAVLRGPQ